MSSSFRYSVASSLFGDPASRGVTPQNFSQVVCLGFGFLHWPCLDESVVYLSVCPIVIITVTHQGAACDTAGVHFGLAIRRVPYMVIGVT